MPAEHHVAVGLHQTLTLDNPLAVASEGASGGIGLQHRGGGLLGLQDQRIALIDSAHQHDPGSSTDAADTDDLPGDVNECVLPKQVTAIGLEALPVFGEELRHPAVQVGRCLFIERQLPGRHNEGRRVDEPELPVDRLGQLLQRAEVVSRPSLVEIPSNGAASLFGLDGAQNWQPGLHREMRVPDIEIVLARKFLHRPSIGSRGSQHNLTAFFPTVSAVPPSDLQAGGQALDVPFEGTGVGFVEVVEVEDKAPLGRREYAEVAEVGITAELRREIRARTLGQIGSHDQRCPAVEGERRDQHASVTNRDQLGYAVGGLLLDQFYRIDARICAVKLGEGLERYLAPHRLPMGDALFPGFGRGRAGPERLLASSGLFGGARLPGAGRSSGRFRAHGSPSCWAMLLTSTQRQSDLTTALPGRSSSYADAFDRCRASPDAGEVGAPAPRRQWDRACRTLDAPPQQPSVLTGRPHPCWSTSPAQERLAPAGLRKERW